MLRFASTTEIRSQRPKGRESALSPLNVAIDALDLAQDAADVKVAQDRFSSASVLLNEADCCRAGVYLRWHLLALGQAMKGRRVGQLSRSVLKAVERLDDVRSIESAANAPGEPLTHLCRTVAEIQGYFAERGKRNTISRRLHAKGDEEAITAWRLDPDETRRGFEVRSLASL